ncbi:MAG: helix-turn-helix domain-containing protein [Gammaproteobacteria bacterium]
MRDDSGQPESAGLNSGRSPGARLKAAREERHLTLDEAAKSLFMARHLLVALEADDFEHLGASVYVRGYLRKYAQFLGLPDDELITDYEVVAAPRDPRVRARAVSGLPRQGTTHWFAPTLIGLVVIVAILVAVWVWRSGLLHKTAANPPPTAVSAAMTMTREVPAKATRATVTPPPPARPTTAATHAQGAAIPKIHLVLKVKAPSWIEVYDAGGKRLYYDLANAGQTLSFDSASVPYKIFLGNAAGIEVEANGQPVSIPAADVAGTTAHFNVPTETTSAPGSAT